MDLYKSNRDERKQINAELKLLKTTIKKLKDRQGQLRVRHRELLKLDLKHQISQLKNKKHHYEAQIANNTKQGYQPNTWYLEQLRYVEEQLRQKQASYEMDKILTG